MSQEPPGLRDYVAARQRALLRTARMLTGDEQTAEDLVQTTLERVWPHWQRVASDRDPDAYVRKVMVNTYSSWWRRKWRRGAADLDPAGHHHSGRRLRAR